MNSSPLSPKRKKKTFIPYEFASQCPEPCLVNKDSPTTSDFNRVLEASEKHIWFLTTYLKYLNPPAQQLLTQLIWRNVVGNVAARKSRFGKNSPNFFLKYWLIRYAGCHGAKSLPLYLITKIDIENALAEFDIEKEYEHRVVTAIVPHDPCTHCGAMNTQFKIREKATILYCGGCLGLPGATMRSL